MSNLEKIVDWYLSSPIYKNGAYFAYYSSRRKGPIYPEITAYAISLSCVLFRRRNDLKFLERAETCAEYLRRVGRNGGIPSLTDNLLYAFDTGIFISSMLDLYKLTEKKVYLNEAEKSLNWLISLWDKTPFSAVDKLPESKAWYHLPSVHLVKLVIPLLKVSKCLGDIEYEKKALKLLSKYSGLQTNGGGFRVNEASTDIMSHPHCYAIEGFLYAYYLLRDQKLLEAARKGSEWLTKVQNSDGSFYRRYTIERASESYGTKNMAREKLKTSDVTAQATRIWKLLGVNQQGIEKAYRYLNDQTKNGGLILFRSGSLTARARELFSWRKPVYSWPTFFYLHSLILPFGKIEYCSELF